MRLEEALKSNKFQSEQHKALLNVFFTAWWFKTIINNQLKPYKLRHGQFNVMRILMIRHPSPMCIKDIAEHMIEQNSNVPRIIDRLENKQLISRHQGTLDARQTLISLSNEGIQILKKATNDVFSKIGHIKVSTEQATVINNILELMRESG